MKSASSTSTSPPTLSFHEIANLVVIVLLSILSVGNADEDATKALAPFIKPPSEEFCSVNQLGDQIYPISVFQACTFKFYVTPLPPSFNTSGSTHDSDGSLFSCDDVLDDDNDMSLISTQYRQVVAGPTYVSPMAHAVTPYSIIHPLSITQCTRMPWSTAFPTLQAVTMTLSKALTCHNIEWSFPKVHVWSVSTVPMILHKLNNLPKIFQPLQER